MCSNHFFRRCDHSYDQGQVKRLQNESDAERLSKAGRKREVQPAAFELEAVPNTRKRSGEGKGEREGEEEVEREGEVGVEVEGEGEE